MLSLALISCSLAENAPLPPQPTLEIMLESPDNSAQVKVLAEVVSTEQTRAHGMMFRTTLAEGKGMLFVWPGLAAPKRNVFWMKNTLVPLDIIFIDNSRVVAVIAHAKPHDETPLDPGVDSTAVLEVPAGYAAKHGVVSGWLVKLLPKPQALTTAAE